MIRKKWNLNCTVRVEEKHNGKKDGERQRKGKDPALYCSFSKLNKVLT